MNKESESTEPWFHLKNTKQCNLSVQEDRWHTDKWWNGRTLTTLLAVGRDVRYIIRLSSFSDYRVFVTKPLVPLYFVCQVWISSKPSAVSLTSGCYRHNLGLGVIRNELACVGVREERRTSPHSSWETGIIMRWFSVCAGKILRKFDFSSSSRSPVLPAQI